MRMLHKDRCYAVVLPQAEQVNSLQFACGSFENEQAANMALALLLILGE